MGGTFLWFFAKSRDPAFPQTSTVGMQRTSLCSGRRTRSSEYLYAKTIGSTLRPYPATVAAEAFDDDLIRRDSVTVQLATRLHGFGNGRLSQKDLETATPTAFVTCCSPVIPWLRRFYRFLALDNFPSTLCTKSLQWTWRGHSVNTTGTNLRRIEYTT